MPHISDEKSKISLIVWSNVWIIVLILGDAFLAHMSRRLTGELIV